MTCEHRASTTQGDVSSNLIDLVRQSLDRIEFGTVQLTIHAGKLVQVDVTEKHRVQQ